MNPEKFPTRDQIQEKFIQWDLDQMSVDDLKQYFINMQNAELDSLDDVELVKEVQQYAPQLIEGLTLRVS